MQSQLSFIDFDIVSSPFFQLIYIILSFQFKCTYSFVEFVCALLQIFDLMSSLFLHESPPILSQHCIDGLNYLCNCSDMEIQRICKYFLQMLVAQRSNIKIGDTYSISCSALSL